MDGEAMIDTRVTKKNSTTHTRNSKHMGWGRKERIKNIK